MRRTWMVVTGIALVVVAPLGAQQQQQEQRERERQQRVELERRMRELQNELRDIQRQLNEVIRDERVSAIRVAPRPSVRVSPGAVVVRANRARIGVIVRGARDAAKDSIGAEITSVTPGGPAEQAGLRTGDIITTFNGDRLTGRFPAASDYESEPGLKLQDFARELEDGDTVQVEYRRGDERRRATIVARELESEQWYNFTVQPERFRLLTPPVEPAVAAENLARAMAWGFGDRWLNMELVSLNAELGEYFGANEGLLVIRASRDSSLNLRGGDVILRVDGRTPSSHSHLMRIFRSYSAGESVQIEIMRQKRRMTVTATIPERRNDHDWDWER